jgi:predicted HTH transcriptional regulator
MIGENSFSRKEYMRHFRDISSATASRDLREATDNQVLTRIGEGRTTVYRYL